MTAKRTDPHVVRVHQQIDKRGAWVFRWECSRGCKGRPSYNMEAVKARGTRHETRRVGRTTRG